MVVVKLPYIQSRLICSKLSKGVGHNLYGEPAWPNDILYIFPVVILESVAITLGLSVGQPYSIAEKANPFATPLEILPEWYFLATFDLLRVLPSKIIGVISMASVPGILILTPLFENTTKFQNPFRRPAAMSVFLFTCVYSLWLTSGSLEPISRSLPLL